MNTVPRAGYAIGWLLSFYNIEVNALLQSEVAKTPKRPKLDAIKVYNPLQDQDREKAQISWTSQTVCIFRKSSRPTGAQNSSRNGVLMTLN